MTYEVRNYEELLGTEGFSDDLLKTHFKLYEGYVKNTNKTLELMKTLEKGGTEYAEVRRRFGWEFNGMRLHEYYFGNLVKGGKQADNESELMKKVVEEFGSVENWEKDFRAVGAMRGIGWVVLYYDCCGKRLFNAWVNEHDCGHPAGCKPLLVLDVFEHAFLKDYNTNKAEYMNSFFKALDWEKVNKRFERCKGKTCAEK